jgi:hypothetical protein
MIIPETFNTRGQRTESFIKKNYPEFYQYLMDNFDGVFAEKLYKYVYHIDKDSVCLNCGKKLNFISYSHGYGKYCCSNCANTDKEKLRKQKETFKERYLMDNGFVNRCKQTMIDRYGENYNDIILEKRKKTCLEKYGCEFPLSNKKIREKINETVSTRSDEEKQKIIEKAKHTKLEKYGDENYINLELIKQNNLKKFGVEYPFQSQEIQEKGKQTRLKKYGSIYPLQNKELNDKSKQTRIQNHINNSDIIIDRIENFDGKFFKCKCPHPECNKCNEKEFIIPYDKYFVRNYENRELCVVLCPGNTNKGTTIELFIRDILDKYNVFYETNNKSILNGKELDIFIPEHNIAIECNGIYWHSLKDSNYHYNKWKKCREIGIKLLSFWEDQILNKPNIVESILLHNLGLYQRKIYARKCNIKIVSNSDALKFLNDNHLQGYVNSSIRVGLYYGDELVSLMAFGKKRGSLGNKGKQNDWELYRFCNKLNTSIAGGASKLLKYFINNYHPNSIESFSSNDISNGELYKTLGFSYLSITKHSYWYIDKDMNRYHRFKFRKSELVKNGENPSESEFEIMKAKGYYRIYDSGQTKYILKLNN